jgi:hypothetical protein
MTITSWAFGRSRCNLRPCARKFRHLALYFEGYVRGAYAYQEDRARQGPGAIVAQATACREPE